MKLSKLTLSLSLTIASCAIAFASTANIPSFAQGRSYNRLRTMFTGNKKCLDIINDSKDNKLIMAKCGRFSGQFWKLEPTRNKRYYRLKTMFTGNDKCLDIINDSKDNKLIMAKCGKRDL